ncbi:MAG: hypothetical protein U0169_12985 [Polyangiaceae bacterium]
MPALLRRGERALAELRTLADDAKREHGGREPDYGDPATPSG